MKMEARKMVSSLRRKSVAVVLVFVLSVVVVGAAEGAVITVKADGTGDYPTIQAAIDAAVGGDEVVLEPGTYTGDGNRDIDYKGKAITVRSTDPEDANVVSATIINCQGSSYNPHRGFHFHSGEDANSVLAGVTITNGYAPAEGLNPPPYYSYGGGISCYGSSPMITRCRIENNHASIQSSYYPYPVEYGYGLGGGICCTAGSNAIISYCTITDNSASGGGTEVPGDGIGGGIYAIGCTITDCIISDNYSSDSGGGANFVSCSVSNCAISGNRARESGGGISCCGETVVTDCEVTENISSKGGGIYCGWDEVVIRRCKVIDNTVMYYSPFPVFSLAEQDVNAPEAEFFPWPPWPPDPPEPRPGVDYFGGGIYCGSEGTALVEGCLIARNEAIGGDAYSTASGGDGYGGGIVGVPESTVIKDSVIVANKSAGGDGSPKGQGYGGGVCSLNGDVTITNCIVWANTSLNGPEAAVTQFTGTATLSVRYSDISGGEAGVYVAEGSLLEWGAGNIEEEPLVTPDGHLQGASPCINAGDPNYVPGPNETDVDGEVRVHNGRIDIGADEFIDSDGDGLPDWWEQEYFGDPTAANPGDDPDDDGRDNLTEYNSSGNPLVRMWYYVDPVDGNDVWDGRSAVWDGVHGPKATIQSAIDAASPEEGTVILSVGTYKGDGNRDLDFRGKAITVRSTNPDDVSVAAGTVIDCNGTSSEPHRGFKFVSGEGPGSVLSGVTIMNGCAPEEEILCVDDLWEKDVGGGILCVESSPTITKCLIKENVGYDGGGGIFAACGSPTVSGCTITGNYGGGIMGADCNFNITGCRISDNSGGIFCYGNDWSVTDCTVTGNSGVGIRCGGFYPSGGKVLVSDCVISGNSRTGIYCNNQEGQTTITDCIISGNGDPEEDYSEGGGVGGSGSEDDLISNCIITSNRAEHGGGIAWWRGTISNCTISDNVAERRGGGLYYCEGVIENCIIRGNRTIDDGYGGGISHFQGELRNCVIAENEATYGGGLSGVSSIKNCTIVDNYAFNGGGIYSAGAVTIANSILRGNGASYGSQLYLKRDVGSTATVSFTDFEDSEGGVYIGAGATLNWGEGNIDAEPQFAFDGDYHLLPGSPCIDGGDPNYVSGPNDVDFEGKVRVMGEAVDMGVYEYEPNSPAIAVSGQRFSFYPEWPEREGQEMEIRNCGDEPLYWEIAEDCGWLEVTPANGVSEGDIDEVTITVDPNGLSPGLYRYTFEVSDPNASNSPVGIEVVMPVGSIIAVPSQDCSTIQCAIDAAQEYDIVVVADGVYSGEGNKDLDFGGKAIAVCSENGPENCIIDYSGSWGFIFRNFEGADSMVKGFTMRGAAIYCRDGSPTIKGCFITNAGITCGPHPSDSDEESHPTIVNCTVENNTYYGIGGGYGTKIINCIVSGNEEGGIVGRSLTVENCEITDNGDLGESGGISCVGLSRISNCTIIGNEGGGNEGGGGISLSGHTTITDCIIMRNLSGGGGGGIYSRRGKVTIRGCTISGNTVETAEGGGICCREGGDVEIFNSIITGNSAKRLRDNEGGGIYVDDGNLSLTNCVVSGNEVRGEAGTAGGGIWFRGENLALKGCTMSGNFSDDMGGGIYCRCDDLTITNCILWGNEGLEGPQVYLLGDSYVCYTNIEGGQSGFHIEGNLDWGEGNIDANPGFAFAGDWHLLEGSVCIDNGDPNYAAEPNEKDIDGNERVMDGDGDGNSAIDMGADEFNPWAATIAVSPKEFSFYYIQDWVKPEAQELQIRNCGGEPLYWQIVEDCNWLEVAPANGVSEGGIDKVEITVEPNLLEAGVYNYSLEVADVNDANNIVVVDVRLCVGVLHYVPSVDCATIQCAIDAAEDYDTVLVGDGVYTGEGNRDLDFGGKAITVQSENGSDNCVIDCEDAYIGFNFHSWEEDESIVDGFSIVDGNRGIYCDRSSPMIRNCVISGHYGSGVFGKYSHSGLKLSGCLIQDNSSEEGSGGIHVERGNLEISNCRVVGNTGRRAAGIYCEGTSIINGCTVEGNEGQDGGGIYCVSMATISGCNITGNTTTEVGGGIRVSRKATVVNCEITDNSAHFAGGICCWNTKDRIENCIISGNTASDSIGGVFFGSSQNEDSVMANCLITGNKSLGHGTGGVGCAGGTISNCTIVGNSALDLGGGVTCSGDVNILNCIMWGNESPAGSEIYSGYEGVGFVSYSDVEGGEGSVYVEPNSVLEWGYGNLDVEPEFVSEGYWVDANDVNIVVEPNDVNAVWVDGDYHLLEGSACIDAGDPNYTAKLDETDLDGNERVVAGRIDMGAYEAGLPPVEVGVKIAPHMLNCASSGKWVKAHVVLPEGYWPEDIDVNTPAVAEPMGAESEYIKVFDNGKGKFGIEIGFDREAFCAAGAESAAGYLDVTVSGWLLTGERFEGADTIKVISRRWHHRHRESTGKD